MGGHSVFDFFIVSGTVRNCMSITNMLKRAQLAFVLTYLKEPLPQSTLLTRSCSFSPLESLLCSSLLLLHTSSIGSDLTSSALRVSGDGVRLPSFSPEGTPFPFALEFEPLPLPVTLPEEPLPLFATID